MPLETNDTVFSGGGEDTFVPALDGEQEQVAAEETEVPALDGAAEPEPEAAPEPEAEAPEEPEAGGTRETLMQKFAQEHGLDLNDARDKKLAQRLADKELFIQKLRGEQGAKGQQNSTEDGVAALMRELRGEDQKGAEQVKPVEQPAVAATPPAAGPTDDVGASWKTPADAYNALNEAWNKGDLEAVTQVENAMFTRRFAEVVPQIQEYVQQRVQELLKEQLGDVVPAMRETVAARKQAEAIEYAVEKLSSVKGFEGVAELDKEIDGDPITFNGQEFRNTPMNRILAENPWILSIQERHADPDTAARLTNLARYQAAFKLHQGSKVSSGQAKALVDAGKKMEARSKQDRTRQSLNGGAGAGTSLTPSQGKTGSYVQDELLGMDEPTSFASLLS